MGTARCSCFFFTGLVFGGDFLTGGLGGVLLFAGTRRLRLLRVGEEGGVVVSESLGGTGVGSRVDRVSSTITLEERLVLVVVTMVFVGGGEKGAPRTI